MWLETQEEQSVLEGPAVQSTRPSLGKPVADDLPTADGDGVVARVPMPQESALEHRTVEAPPEDSLPFGNVTEHRSPPCVDAGQKARKPILGRLSVAIAIALLAAPLGACNRSTTPVEHAAFVRTEIVQPRNAHGSVTLTGEVQARFRPDLSFRVSGRVLDRLVDVGAHVNVGEVLARLDPAEQQADLDASTAAVVAAEAQLRVARDTFDRQSNLISSGFTTSVAYEQAKEGLRTAESTLETAKAQLGTAKDALGYSELRVGAAGMITVRNVEVGQVVQAAQTVFTLAQDGDRDAIFDVPESMPFGEVDGGPVSLRLVSDPDVTAVGQVREISPAVDPKNSTVRVKVAIQNPPAAMTLGSAIAGTAPAKAVTEITLPWTALMATGSKPAVWIVEPRTRKASLKPVTIGAYEAGAVLIKAGLKAGDRVVVDGGKLLSSGQPVTYDGDQS